MIINHRRRFGNQPDPLKHGIQFCDWARANLSTFIDANGRELLAACDSRSQDALLGLHFSLLQARDALTRGMNKALGGMR